MISKGTAHNNGARLARYMTTEKDGERAVLWELRGFASADITEAFRSVHVMAEATKCKDPFFHVQVRNPAGEELDRTQWVYVADRIERMLGLKDQPRAIAFHIDEKTGDEHMHIAWSRIDDESLTARPLPFFKDRLKKISRELELHFGLKQIANHRDSSIKFAPTRDQEEQARRLRVDLHATRQTIRDCFDHSDDGRSFEAALAEEGLLLTQGDRRAYVVIDHAGGMHALGKRILDVSASQLRERFSDISRDHLPSVEQARAFAQERQQLLHCMPKMPDRDREEIAWLDALAEAAIDKERGRLNERDAPPPRNPFEPPGRAPDHPQLNRTSPQYWFEDVARQTTQPVEKLPPDYLNGAQAEIWLAYQNARDAAAFTAALAEKDLYLSCVTTDEARWIHRDNRYLRVPSPEKEPSPLIPKLMEAGEFVVLNNRGHIYQITPRNTGVGKEDLGVFLRKLEPSRFDGIETTRRVIEECAGEHEVMRRAFRDAASIGLLKHEARVAEPLVGSARDFGAEGSAVGRGAGRILDGLVSAIESLLAPEVTPEQRQENEIAARETKLDNEQQLDFERYASELARTVQRQQELAREVGLRERQDDDRDRG